MLPPQATAEQVAALEHEWGLDEPLPVQYVTFLTNAVQGEFGRSYTFRQDAADVIWNRLPTTLRLVATALLIVVPLGIAGGVMSALYHNRTGDVAIRALALVSQSIPSFWLGLVLVAALSVKLGWFPASGATTARSYILPAVAVATFPLAALLRITRSSVLEVLNSDFVEFARSKGLSEWRVTWIHVLRASLIAPITYLGFATAALVAGSVVVETVFAMPGVGYLSVIAVRSLDYPVIQAVILLFVVINVFQSFAVDLTYRLLDPRVTHL